MDSRYQVVQEKQRQDLQDKYLKYGDTGSSVRIKTSDPNDRYHRSRKHKMSDLDPFPSTSGKLEIKNIDNKGYYSSKVKQNEYQDSDFLPIDCKKRKYYSEADKTKMQTKQKSHRVTNYHSTVFLNRNNSGKVSDQETSNKKAEIDNKNESTNKEENNELAIKKKSKKKKKKKKNEIDTELTSDNTVKDYLVSSRFVPPKTEKILPSCTVSQFSANDSGYFTNDATASTSAYNDTRDEVCDMDIDEEDIQMLVDLREFREEVKFAQNESVGKLTQTVTSNLHLLKQSSNLPDKVLYIVIDTNILIDKLNFVADLRDSKLEGFGLPYLLIPWIVLQELDGLKDGRKASVSERCKYLAKLAVSYLFSCFQSRHPRVLGQSCKQAKETLDNLQIECSDDRVLQAIFQCMRDHPDSCVVLLTADKNLCNKAVVNGIEVFDKEKFCKGQPRLLKNPNKNECCDQNKSQHYSSKPHSQSYQETSFSSISPCTDSSQIETVDKVFCITKDIIRDVFGTVLETEMKNAFGDMWSQIIYRKPPWSAYDVLLSFQKHWMAVFGLIFNRRLLNNIDFLVTVFSPKGVKINYPTELLQETLILLNEFKTKTSCKDVVLPAVNQIKKLLCQTESKCKILPSSGSEQTENKLDKRKNKIPEWCENSKKARNVDENEHTKSNFKDFRNLDSEKRASAKIFAPENVAESNRNILLPQKQVTSPTVSATSQKTSASSSSDKKPLKENEKYNIQTAEVLIRVQNVFQVVWENINHLCNMIQDGVQKGDSSRETEMVVGKLLPLMTDLQQTYYACLSIPPLDIHNRRPQFDSLSCHLNTFLSNLDLQAQQNVTTEDLLAFFATLEKRPVLQAGLGQLETMILSLTKCFHELSQ